MDEYLLVDTFAFPVRFPWHSAKNVTRDPALFPEEFLCLVRLSRHYTLDEETYPLILDKDGEDMDIFAFIHTPDPTKVKVAERQRVEDEPRLLETTVGRTIPLLPVAPERAESELEASVDKLFDEGGSGAQTEQGDFDGGGNGQGINIQSITETTDVVVEVVVPLQPRRSKKRKTIIADAGGPLHPPKLLREDHGTPSGASVGGKSRSTVQRLLAGSVQNAEVRGEPIPTLPFMTSFVSATSEHKGEDHTDSVTGLNLRTISAPERFVISSDSSHHSGANVVEAEVDSFAMPFILVITTAIIITSTADPATVVQEKNVKPSTFYADSTSAGGTDPATGGFTDLIGSDLLVGGIRTVIDPESDLQKVYIPQWNVMNGSRLDDGGV
ncbi:hypothetical protein Tco_0385372 [Tanacetum coccineum]